jgi:hypothetical protein
MEKSTAMTIFFVSIFVGVILFVIGLVLLFRPANTTGSASVIATVIDVQPREYDNVITIKYTVNNKVYTYMFASVTDRFIDGQRVTFDYNPSNPAEPAGKKVNTAVHVTGLILVILSMIVIIVGTIWSYAQIATVKSNGSFMNSLFSKK